MSQIKVTDYYYGAALSALFNYSVRKGDRKISAAIIESNANRQLYRLTTDNNECQLFIKYCIAKTGKKKEDYNSWYFNLTKREKNEIQDIINEGHNLVLALVCGVAGLSDSELALLDKNQIKRIIDLGKDSITISHKKRERAYRISIGGGRENAMQVAFNRFKELF
jgi:hypothetical protein